MCFADGSSAPAAPSAGQAGQSRALTLTASDGTVLMAHETRALTPSQVGIVVMPDVRGLHQYYRDLTVRLAELGWESVAIDYFARTADSDDRSEAFEFMPHVQQVTAEGMAVDVRAAADHLWALGCTKVFTLGFCMGGSWSWRQSADTPGLAGCIGFYGRRAMAEPRISELAAPLLLLAAGADAHIPVEDPQSLAADAPVEAEVVVFDGAPHSFFDRTAPEHADACAKAWGHITDFVAARS